MSTESSLQASIKMVGGNLIDLPHEKFKQWAATLSTEEIDLLLEKHRGTRNFYKKILQEEYRKKHPNSWRYEDAANKLQKYNDQGKMLSEIRKELVTQS